MHGFNSKRGNFGIASLIFLSGLIAATMAYGETRTFNGEADLTGLELEGGAVLDASKAHDIESGSALKIPTGGKVKWLLRSATGMGKVSILVFEDGAAAKKPKESGAGALWGLGQPDGTIIAVGAIYAPYLSGAETYAVGSFNPASNGKPWQNVQYLGIKRKPGWHMWTFEFTEANGLQISYDGVNVNAKNQCFNWMKTNMRGFDRIMFFGDATDAGQTLWIDDVNVTLDTGKALDPLWPPPPPKELAVFIPPIERNYAPYAAWKKWPGQDPSYFPIAVWLQDPKLASKYKEAGMNLYIGLWKGPTEEQLEQLRAAGMPVICDQNEVAMKHLDDPIIVGWMHGDEPDNAQSFETVWKNDVKLIDAAWPEYAGRTWKGYGPPLAPKTIIEEYAKIKKNDPTRPVLLNLGQGVAWEGWGGRGLRSGKLEDYPEYVKGGDVITFDIYPAVHNTEGVAGNLWYQARGIRRLLEWTGGEKTVWNCMECTRISNPGVKPTPDQVRSEVWMSIIHGSRGLIWFVHQFKPSFNAKALLDDPEMLAAVTKINNNVRELAPVINSASPSNSAKVASSNENVPVHIMTKQHDGATYIFAVSMYKRDTNATFSIDGLTGANSAEVLGENRTIPVKDGMFKDDFTGYAAHIYKVR
jgi:hypothetical protein